MKIETKSLGAAFEVKADTTESGTFRGYASTFGNLDRDDDIIAKGAFGPVNAKGIKLLWQHNMSEPIGIWTKLVEDEKGLYAEGKLALKTQRGAEAYELMKMGALSDMSIGFRTVDAEVVKHSDAKRGSRNVRRIKKVNLHEVSLVSIPANPLAMVDQVKGMRTGVANNALPEFDPEELMTEREFERQLRDAGLSRKMAQILVAEGLGGIEGYMDTLLRDAAGLSCKAVQIILDGGYRSFVSQAKSPKPQSETVIDTSKAASEAAAELSRIIETETKSKSDVTDDDADRVHLRDADAEAKSSGQELIVDLSFFEAPGITIDLENISGARAS